MSPDRAGDQPPRGLGLAAPCLSTSPRQRELCRMALPYGDVQGGACSEMTSCHLARRWRETHGEGTGSRHRLLGEDGVERCNLQKSNVFEQEGVKHKMRAHTDLPGNQVELGPMSQAARVKGPRSAPSGLGPASSGLCFLFPALPISVDFRNYSLDHREQFFKVVAHGVF